MYDNVDSCPPTTLPLSYARKQEPSRRNLAGGLREISAILT